MPTNQCELHFKFKQSVITSSICETQHFQFYYAINAKDYIMLFLQYSYIKIIILGQQSKMAQWIKVLVTKSEDMSFIPGTHTVERNYQLLQGDL